MLDVEKGTRAQISDSSTKHGAVITARRGAALAKRAKRAKRAKSAKRAKGANAKKPAQKAGNKKPPMMGGVWV